METETRSQAGDSQAGSAAGTRRKLTEDQEREVTRLYADTETPVSEISKRFGIGESSVYRVAQRHGAKLRGRQPGAPRSSGPRATGARRGPRAGGARAAAAASTTAAATPATPARRGRRPRAAVAATGAPGAAAAATGPRR